MSIRLSFNRQFFARPKVKFWLAGIGLIVATSIIASIPPLSAAPAVKQAAITRPSPLAAPPTTVVIPAQRATAAPNSSSSPISQSVYNAQTAVEPPVPAPATQPPPNSTPATQPPADSAQVPPLPVPAPKLCVISPLVPLSATCISKCPQYMGADDSSSFCRVCPPTPRDYACALIN